MNHSWVGSLRRGKGDLYSSGNFPLVSERPPSSLLRYGLTDLPWGIERVYCEYYVLGPSIMGMVLMFVPAVDEAKRIDRVVREDAESRLDRRGKRVGVKTVAGSNSLHHPTRIRRRLSVHNILSNVASES
jgi:hypothetical protein